MPEQRRSGRRRVAVWAAGAVVMTVGVVGVLLALPDADRRPVKAPVATATTPPPPVTAVERGRTNTGWRGAGLSESDLVSSESITITEPGAVVEHLDVTGRVVIRADDVTFRKSRVRGTGTYGIEVGPEHSGVLIEDVEVVGVSGDRSAAVAPYGDWTLRRSDLSGFRDIVKVSSDQVVEDSWLHDVLRTEDSHNDLIQAVGGSDVVIRGNRLEGPWQASTSALILTSNRSPIVNYTIEDNFISGGTYAVYLRHKEGRPAPAGIVLSGNVFDGLSSKKASKEPDNSWKYGPRSFSEGTQYSADGNTWVDGRPYDF